MTEIRLTFTSCELTCLCCGHTETFESDDAAFEAEWDTPKTFRLAPVCPICPTSHIMIHGLEKAREMHAAAHARWKTEGRPT